MSLKKLDLLRIITSSNYLYNFSSSYSNKALTASYSMNGGAGGSGTSGTSGASGSSGSSGQSGTSGSSGSSGTSATAGSSGTSGSGSPGSSGSSGTSGSSATAGSSGTSGVGSPGTSGSSGATGTSGSSGSSGATGTPGSSGTSGAGAAGTQGTSGSSGVSGTATLQTGSLAKQTIFYNVISGSSNTITGLNLSSNKWGVDIKEEWDAKSITGGDQYYPSCSLLMHFSGSNGSTTFIDNSPVTKSFTVNGNSQISTAQSKFGGASAYFDGTGDYLSTNSSNDFAFGTGDFTVECWIYSSDVSNPAQRGFLQTSDTAGGLKTSYTTGITILQGSTPSVGLSGALTANVAGSSVGSSTAVITTNTWYHIALVRNSGTSTLYVNGTSVGSGTTTGNCSGTYLAIGGYYNTSYLYQGYLDELRITKGVARYTTNFTPQTSEFPNSQFLTQYATKYVGLIGGLNDKSVDYGVQKLSDSSLKVVKMTQTTSPFPSGSLSSSVDRVYVNVLDYTKVSVTSSYATNALTASYVMGGAAGSSGTSGANGTSGSSGQSGTSGTSATAGSSGTSGVGSPGTSGSSGTSGASGSSGASGTAGSSGSSGKSVSLTTGSLYPITASWSRRAITASYALTSAGGGGSGTVSSGTVNRLAKYTGATTVGSSAIVYESGSAFIGIGVTGSLVSSLQVYRSGSNASVLKVDGGSGTLFEVTDNLSGSLFNVNDITGLPIFES